MRVTPADLDFMLDEYYEARGWDRDSIPRPERLQALSQQDLDADLEPIRAECRVTTGERRGRGVMFEPDEVTT